MRRRWLAVSLVSLFGPVRAADAPALPAGSVVLLRHALAPGGGDPPGFRLDDCASQRNLSEAGREQARRIGALFAERGIEVGAVWSSQWCRTRETADLAFPGRRQDRAAFNSYFSRPEAGPAQTRAALEQLAAWRGPGVLVVFTHQVNISALTGVAPDSGTGVVVIPRSDGLNFIARWP